MRETLDAVITFMTLKSRSRAMFFLALANQDR